MNLRTAYRLTAMAGLAVAAAAIAAPAAAVAQPAPATAAKPAGDYEVRGFRGAKFGMTQAQVRAAVLADFPNARITSTANVNEGTEALQATIDRIDPGPGPALVTYIFGATAKTLTHVNVIWEIPGQPTSAQRDSVVAAAVQLTNYFQTLPTPPKATTGPTPIGPNALLMYGAVDKRGGGVEVAVSGIAYQAQGAPADKALPPPTGPASLRISYISNVANPDIKRIAPGSF